MKKFLSLVLALVMTMSLVTVSAGAADFTDDSTITYKEAVDVMTALKVVGGYDNGSFGPKGTLTRGAAAKIICNLILGSTTSNALVASSAPYSDVPADSTFAGYIAYLAKEGIVGGYADGTFRPAAPLTGYAFMKMLLGVIGLDAKTEGYNDANWSIAVAKRALSESVDLTDGLVGDFDGTKTVTREEACLYAFNAIKAVPFTYDTKSSIVVGDIVVSNTSEAKQVGTDPYYDGVFGKLVYDDGAKNDPMTDAYGRPAHEWIYDKESVGVYADSPIVAYTDKVEVADLKADLKAEGYKAAATGFAIKSDDTTLTGLNPFVDGLKDSDEFGGVGTVLEYYGKRNETSGKYEITSVVVIETHIAEIASIAKDKTSTTSKDERAFTLKSVSNGKVAYEDEQIDNFDEIYKAIEEGDYVLYTKNVDHKIETVAIPETVEGVVTKSTDSKVTMSGVSYKVAAKGTAPVADADEQTLWLDTYGNVMKGEVSDTSSDVVYVVDVYDETDKWGEITCYVRVVTAEGEIVDLKTKGETKYTISNKLVTYTTDSDGYATLVFATDVDRAVTADTKASATKLKGVNTGDYFYFADEVTFVYVDGDKSDLEVSVANGVQALKLATNTNKQARFVLNDDDEITVVFVTGAAEAVAASDLLFVKSTAKAGKIIDGKGNVVDSYNFYINGEKMTESASGLDVIGLYTYSIEESTGKYKAEHEDASALGVVYDADKSAVNVTIKRDKYVTITGSDVSDYTLAADCNFYDLTENDIDSLADLVDMAEELVDLKIAVAYDEDENEITTLYVY